MNKISTTDIVVIGAGMAGLVCTQQLQKAGYSVQIVEKSRGVGGRVATRRLYDTRADHGVGYIKPEGELLQSFVDVLFQEGILQVWTDRVYKISNGSYEAITASSSPYYIAPDGMSAIAKFIAKDLDVHLGQRASKIVYNIAPNADNFWKIITESGEEFSAKALVIAIPAPQAVEVLERSLSTEGFLNKILNKSFFDKLCSADYYPSISVMAGYSNNINLLEWKALTFSDDAVLEWIGVDSSKRKNSLQPLLVFQSSVNFAQKYLESSDLQSVGQKMLQYAARSTNLVWLENPKFIQVHRWRYAFPHHPLSETCLSTDTDLPLVCCGDWCGGDLIIGNGINPEGLGKAIASGLDAAKAVNNQLKQKNLSKINFF